MEKAQKENVVFQIAEIKLSYHPKVKASQRKKITSSEQAYDMLLQQWDQGAINFVEQFKAILLNRAHKVLGIYLVSTGGVSGTAVDPKLVFAAALKANASAIILAHNHPSGNLYPSEADKQLTRKIREAGKYLELPILDHVIVTPEGYYSFADEGIL
jgi:DNA repair protein RadC